MRSRGFRDDSLELHELLRTRHETIAAMMASDDPRIAVQGLRALDAVQRERRAILELEVDLAKAGMQAWTAYEVARLQLHDGDSGPVGATPEQLNVVLAEIMDDSRTQQCA